jgi:histone H2A
MASAKKRTATKKSAGAKSATVIPSGRIGSMLRKGRFARRVSKSSGFYLAGVLSYLTHELLEVAVKGVKKGSLRVTPRALTLAVRADDELGALLQNVTIARGGVPTGINAALEKKNKAAKKAGKKSSKKAAKKAAKKSGKK